MLVRKSHPPTSEYAKLYDILIPPEHELRRILALVDFSFVFDELAAKYCPDFGRVAIDPVQMFKYVYLKARYNLSDRDLVERAKTDMAFKFFLGLAPEDDVIHPSLLSKFRRQRLQDADLLNILLRKTFQIGIAKGVLESDTIIVDATHTLARFNQKKPVDALRESTKKLRKSIHQGAPAVAAEFPEKNAEYDLEAEKKYTQKLIDVVRRHPQLAKTGAIAEALHATEELTDNIQEYQDFSHDEDARVGHKTADSSFYGYKQHFAETEDGLISAVVVTSGEQGDGPYLPELVHQSTANGVEVREVIGDRAYSGKKNIQFADEHDFLLISRLLPITANGSRNLEDKWHYNKDAGMMVCPHGIMAYRKAKQNGGNQSKVMTYYMDTNICRTCPLREGCYRPGAKSKTYSVIIRPPEHSSQLKLEETEYFQQRVKKRYMIEQKNSELKNKHGLARSWSNNLAGVRLQGIITIFEANIRRLVKLIDEKNGKKD